MIRNDDGIALILTLWILTILSVIGLSFAHRVRFEVKIASYHRDELKALALAQAGVEIGIAKLTYDLTNGEFDSLDDNWATESEMQIKDTSGEVVDTYRVRITDEARKFNINARMEDEAKRRILRDLLKALEIKDAEPIADCILDWIDEDDLHRLNGAENSYYQNLDEPYECKNGPLDTVGELLLVKGITPTILYGDGSNQRGLAYRQAGLTDFITVCQEDINVNTASEEFLQALLGEFDPNIAKDIVAHRAGVDGIDATDDDRPWRRNGDVEKMHPPESRKKLQEFLKRRGISLGVRSFHFKIESIGALRDERVVKRVVAIVDRSTSPIRIIYWREG